MASNRFVRQASPGAICTIALILALGAGARDAAAGVENCKGKARRTACASPGTNVAPTIAGSPATDATVGSPYSFAPSASDPDSSSLTFGIFNKPPWASFSTSNGRLSGTPGPAAVGEHIGIVISVSDGRSTAALPAFSILVGEGNHAPSISGTPPAFGREGQAYDFVPSASDPDGNAITFTVSNKPAWMTFDVQSGRLGGTPGPGSVGIYANIVIRVTDGSLVSALPAFSIDVEQASLGSATLSWGAPTERSDGTPLTNLAGYRVRYGTSPGNYSNQVQIPNPGITSCVIENLPKGTYYFVATAYDASGNESQFSTVVTKTIS